MSDEPTTGAKIAELEVARRDAQGIIRALSHNDHAPESVVVMAEKWMERYGDPDFAIHPMLSVASDGDAYDHALAHVFVFGSPVRYTGGAGKIKIEMLEKCGTVVYELVDCDPVWELFMLAGAVVPLLRRIEELGGKPGGSGVDKFLMARHTVASELEGQGGAE